MRRYAETAIKSLNTKPLFDPYTLCFVESGGLKRAEQIRSFMSEMNFDVVEKSISARQPTAYAGINEMQINKINAELDLICAQVRERGVYIVLPAKSFPQCAGLFKNEDKRFTKRICRGADLELTTNRLIGKCPVTAPHIMSSKNNKANNYEKFGENVSVADIETEYDRYTNGEALDKRTFTYLQYVDAQDIATKKTMKIPAHIWVTQTERLWILNNLKRLAELGIVAAIGKGLYQRFRDQNTQKAREHIQRLNAHNDKLGFDYSVPLGAFVYSHSNHFRMSTYKEFLKLAADFQRTKHGNTAYADFL